MEDIIEDMFRIYMSCVDSNYAKIHQTINDKYTKIDKAMLTIYLYIKLLEDRNEKNQNSIDVLENYLLKQTIYSETGNISIEISDESKVFLYDEILDNLVVEKFKHKNRVMKKLQYNYKKITPSKYSNLISFLEDIAEFSIFYKLSIRGNKEAEDFLETIKNKITRSIECLDINDYFYKEKKEIIELITNNTFFESQYGQLQIVALNLRDVYRYSILQPIIPENVLTHQYLIAVASIIMAEYCNFNLKEKFDIYTIIVKSLFHDFGEYKGTEIVTQFKNYNDVSKKMFAEIEENAQKELEEKIGSNLYSIICKFKNGKEGYLAELNDKILGIFKIWIEIYYLNNNVFIKTSDSIYQDRFKRFMRIKKLDDINNKDFFLDLLRESYIYIKEHVIEKDVAYFLKYYTAEELQKFRDEINNLKNNPDSFLNA